MNLDCSEPIIVADVLSGINPQVKPGGLRGKTVEKTEQLAKDFESVLLTKLFDAMSQTTKLDSEQGEDSAGGQVQGLFWLYLAQDVADKGGLGLWKDLYRFFSDLQNPAEPVRSIDEEL